jgi:hypothetical protein
MTVTTGVVNGWAIRPQTNSVDGLLEGLRRYSVGLIATPRSELRCARRSEWRDIEADTKLCDFDQIPLTGPDGKQIEAMYVRDGEVVPLNERMLMGADGSLLAFLQTADSQRFRLLLLDTEIVGLVTLSDLQKLPVYSVLFGLVIAVEMLMVEWIRKRCQGDDALWLDKLEKEDRKTIESYWKRAVVGNVAIDRLSCASFGQELVAADGLGLFDGQAQWKGKLGSLQRLRNVVCHGGDIAWSPDSALELPKRARDAQAAVKWLETQRGVAS